ncbi:MFS transporter [Streptomyces sp. NPDC048606]|uniref:MFS transporter n=1 Tax=Streptomyces sp. NPDC048606 TaxID=3154726 RepID=UPI003414E3FE
MSLLKDLRALPRPAKTLLALGAANNVGSGLVLPFLVVYIHQINGLGLTTAMHAVSVTSVAVILGGLHAGRLADRIGARRAAAAHMLLSAVGVAGYAFASEAWHFLLAAAVWGLGLGGSSAWNTLLAGSVPAESHPVVFGSSFTLANAAMGIGGLLGGTLATVSHPLSFRLLYGADALSYLGIAVAMFLLRGLDAAEPTASGGGRGAGGAAGYRRVLSNGPFLLVMGLGTALYFASYGQLEAGLPAVVLTSTDVDSGGLAVLFAVNTAGVIGAQLALHELIKRWRHTRTVAVAALAWALNWALVLCAVAVDGRGAQLGVLIAAMALFAVAETLYAAGMPSLVNSLAAPELRGRFNAAYGSATSVGFVTGPLAAGVLVAGGSGPAFVVGLAVVCALIPPILLAATPLLRRAEVAEPVAERVAEPVSGPVSASVSGAGQVPAPAAEPSRDGSDAGARASARAAAGSAGADVPGADADAAPQAAGAGRV